MDTSTRVLTLVKRHETGPSSHKLSERLEWLNSSQVLLCEETFDSPLLFGVVLLVQALLDEAFHVVLQVPLHTVQVFVEVVLHLVEVVDLEFRC